MKGFSKILMGIGIVVAISALAMPAALAQCATSREFGAQGNAALAGRIKISGFPNDGNELASFWDPATLANNGGDHFAGPNLCPTASWYLVNGFTSPDAGIRGFIASPGCFMTACPDPGAELAVVVEDQNGADAGFILYVTQETPAAIRWYAHDSTDAGATPGSFVTHELAPYPRVDVTASSGPPPNTTTTSTYVDLALNFHGSTGGTPNSDAGQGVVSYDIVSFNGGADPGRLRSAWTPVKSIPYAGGGVVGDNIAVECGDAANDTFLAVGATFVGGVQSLLVGSPTAIECDPNIADPDGPSLQRPDRPSRRSVGRAGR